MSQDAQDGDVQTQQPQGPDTPGCDARQEPCQARCRFTWKELLAVVVVICLVIFLLLPLISSAREASRRMACTNNLKQIGLALHNYENANKAFPPGTICAMPPLQPGNQYDVLKEAAQTKPGFHGTSIFLRIAPFIVGDSITLDWQFPFGISNTDRKITTQKSNLEIAKKDFPGGYGLHLYCPSRREHFRPEDKPMMLSPAWTGGGTDYGGCAGRHAAFSLSTGYNICDASMRYTPEFTPDYLKGKDDNESRRWGIFGRVNASTKFQDIRDGTSNTIMTGELQRFTDVRPISRDGWAIGGPCTLFTTGAMARRKGNTVEMVASPSEGKLMNNSFFGSPGSQHARGANFGLADGSVRFLSERIDPNVFANLGSMSDADSPCLPAGEE